MNAGASSPTRPRTSRRAAAYHLPAVENAPVLVCMADLADGDLAQRAGELAGRGALR